MDRNRILEYMSILRIRQKAYRRNAAFTGILFLVALLGIFAFGMLDLINGRSVYLGMLISVGLGISFLTAWIRLLTISNTIELIENMR